LDAVEASFGVSVPEDVSTQQVRDRVLDQYLPAWCAAPYQPEPYDPSAFVSPDWSFLTPGLAHWFLIAMDKGVVEVSEGAFKLGNSWSEGIFEQAGPKGVSPRPTKLRKESFFEIAAVGMLAVRYGWPVERLRFQPPGWALDFLAYADDEWSEVVIAGEAKRLQRDAIALSASLEVCGALGPHDEADCTEPKNHHRKYLGLLKFRPRILWIVGPEAFAADPDLVFRVEESSRDIVRLRPIDASELTSSSP
jgi:hypothetical protein